jgi:1-acyl-sn-glycerol-3-phosphate acyltransferase
VVSLRISGAQHIPADGGVIVAPNHKNFLGPFFIGITTRRHVRFMAKIELFKGPLRGLFLRLGEFPIRRGESDAEALDTAAAILRAGDLVVVFPESTRVEEPDALGAPRHGAGRLAIVPAPSAGHDPASELIAAALAAAGVGSGLRATRRLQASRQPRLLGEIEPRRLRLGRARRRRLGRLRLRR